MPCSHQYQTYTNSRYIYRGVTPYKMQYDCTKCASCIAKYKKEWRCRAYYEAKDCLDNGGYILFDTLTYHNGTLPRLSDYLEGLPSEFDGLAFSRKDIQDFFKRLRVNLSRSGHHHEGKLRYLLSSEFGTSDFTRGYQNSKRPHYHLLLYVNFDINPLELSSFISTAWINGITDGVKPMCNCDKCPVKDYCKGVCLYKSPQYVLHNRYINGDVGDAIKAANYVTKYVSKDMVNLPELVDNTFKSFSFMYPSFEEDYNLVLEYRKYCRNVLPFHLQSKGFGLSALYSDEYHNMIERCQVCFPVNNKNVIQSIPLPRYYFRKLFQFYLTFDGKVKWFNNALYVHNRLKLLNDDVVRLRNQIYSWDNSLGLSKSTAIARYAIIYRGCVCHPYHLRLSDSEFYKLRLSNKYPKSDRLPIAYNFNGAKNRLTFAKFVANGFYIDSDGEIHYTHQFNHHEWRPPYGYIVVNDKSMSWSHGFDAILDRFYLHQCGVSSLYDVVAFNKASLIDRFKTLGLLQ